MPLFNLDSVTEALQNTRVSPSGVTFAGKSLKLDGENEVKPVVDAIEKCEQLQYLNLEGNTLGVAAAQLIAKALEKHPEFKRALWKDMFTGRMKTEIPKALQYLGEGLVTAGAKLLELDLSDNAFGPIGVEGLASLLRSPTCYALEELRLNNNGLGITGGKLLASALLDCYNSSKKEEKPLALRVFIAGRNRLENEGAKALARVFQTLGTLEEIAMPQNGIYYPGITALSDAFNNNPNLLILNLNDNTIGYKGALALSKTLPHLQKLKEINFGDCLLQTKGAELIVESLKTGHLELEKLVLESNEIKSKWIANLIEMLVNKSKLKDLLLDGNQFGEQGKTELEEKLKKIGKLNVLGSLEDNESEDEEEEEEIEESGDSSDENEDGHEEEEDIKSEHFQIENDVTLIPSTKPEKVTAREFIEVPSADNFLALGENRLELIFKEINNDSDINVEEYIKVLMKVSSLCNNNKENVSELSASLSESLYKKLFVWAQDNDKVWLVNNHILTNLGLLKNEDKMWKPTWDLSVCSDALQKVLIKNYVPDTTRETLRIFMLRQKKEENGVS